MSTVIRTMSFDEFLEKGPHRGNCTDYLKDKRRRKASCFRPQTVIYMQTLGRWGDEAPPIKTRIEGRRHACIRGSEVLVFVEFESDAIQIVLTIDS